MHHRYVLSNSCRGVVRGHVQSVVLPPRVDGVDVGGKDPARAVALNLQGAWQPRANILGDMLPASQRLGQQEASKTSMYLRQQTYAKERAFVTVLQLKARLVGATTQPRTMTFRL